MAVPNKFKVHQTAWSTWTQIGRDTFNGVFEIMRDGQQQFLHPKQDALSAQKWRTVAWNAAWVAADVASGNRPEYPK